MAPDGRPTYIRVNKKHLLPETLDAYNLPWEWFDEDREYLVIKKYIDDDLLEELFQHTRDLKAPKPLIDRGTLRPSRPYRGDGYSRPRDDDNNLLNLEVNLEDEETFRMPTMTFRNTGELLEDYNDLRRRYKFGSLTRASVMSARQHWDREDCPGVAFDYFDAVSNALDSQFRWIHGQTRVLSLDSFQLFLSRLPELDEDEIALATKLLRQIKQKFEPNNTPSRRLAPVVRRADGEKGRDETKWVTFLNMPYLSTQESEIRRPLDQQYSFTQSLVQYQYPLEAAIEPDRQQLNYSIRKAYPARRVHVPMFWALLTSSGECQFYLSTLPYMVRLNWSRSTSDGSSQGAWSAKEL
ncbi:hypothetical protein PV08_06645 [Exophiala spinifera]|uniref:Uncharacterized protein n=1 Tax=Exophiala spinifera TaxID=91928 RepID=A0A0D2B587_9EURO|nr:uncharacterized protein PV08_06645 [Exophiala spinifera]KIW13865.1 hypothetical protein PV08_06645 [Exophiala spinifera]